ncbi:precorrin-6A/cobalt-precorrin-6A reductase, partial [Intestinimonas butyriciproducens]
MHILLFGGTSEGRELAEWLAGEGVGVTLCVATGYGASLIPSDPRIRVHTGRLD